MMLFLALLGWTATAQDCTSAEFEATGYLTGQNIELNYEASQIQKNEDEGTTDLHLEFFVPKRYVDQHEANSFALTFNRARGDDSLTIPDTEDADWKNQVRMNVGQDATADQSACFSNRYDNYTYCEEMVEGLWSTTDVNTENPCIVDVKANIPWSDVMGTAFTGRDVQVNGNWIEIFLTATVETWTHFTQSSDMTGGESWLNKDVENGDTNRQGEYADDAGWRGYPGDANMGDFGDIVIDDERYTLYQIPFIIRWPRTVMVETSFMAAQKITLLTGVVAQDVIQVDLNPREGVFARVEAVLTTQVQYPYGIRSPDEDTSPMTVVVGGSRDGGGTHAASVEFIEFDHEGSCMEAEQDFRDEGVCTQNFKFRMTPTAENPCSVAGEYTFEMWATCIAKNERDTQGCAIDDLVDEDSLELKRTSNSYFQQTVEINHQDFCPELMDEVRVVGDFAVYKDEGFEYRIDNDEDPAGANVDYNKVVYTNDQLYYEATYRTASASVIASEGYDFKDNDESPGNDDIIDYVRATKIFLDVTLGQQRDGSSTAEWDATNWADNMDFSPLGSTRVPGSEIQADDILVTMGSGDAAKYNILLCDVPEVDAAFIQDSVDKATDCFTNPHPTGVDYLDFTKVMSSLVGSANTIDENEIAFNMRMDERIFPVGPATDNSFVTVTVEAEVYYKGNRHPTRRLLQTDAPAGTRNQKHAMSVGYGIQHTPALETCVVDNKQEEGLMKLTVSYNSVESMPKSSDMTSFVTELTMQLDAYHQVRGAYNVEKVEKCDKECMMVYAKGSEKAARRRAEVEGAHLNIYLKVSSVSTNQAGYVMNVFQNNLKNPRSDMHKQVTLFETATVSKLAVDGCNGAKLGSVKALTRETDEEVGAFMDMFKEESSAARPTALLALALLYLAW